MEVEQPTAKSRLNMPSDRELGRQQAADEAAARRLAANTSRPAARQMPARKSRPPEVAAVDWQDQTTEPAKSPPPRKRPWFRRKHIEPRPDPSLAKTVPAAKPAAASDAPSNHTPFNWGFFGSTVR